MKNLYFLLFSCLLSSSLLAQNFEEISDTPFDGVWQSSIAFADVDNDGDQDMLITGVNDSGMALSRLYTNDGDGNYTEVLDTPFDAVFDGSIAFADVDNDGDQDVLLTGFAIAKLYTNDGSGNFTEVVDTPFDGVGHSSIAFADVDNDGDQDVLITGNIGFSNSYISKLYTNDGNGVFTEVVDTPFGGVYYGSVAFADINDDVDQDVLITGQGGGGFYTNLYTNDGDGVFTEELDTPFDGVGRSSIAFADVENDGDQDVLITGSGISKLYTNDGDGNFTEELDTPFDGVTDGSIAFADIDNDLDKDVLITGWNSDNGRIAKLYTNDGSGNFTEVLDTPFDGVDNSSIAFADIDNDGDQDVLITGRDSSIVPISKLYRNLSSVGINENTLFSGISIYPNPVSDELYISSDQVTNRYKIYNQIGQVLLEGNEVISTINISTLEVGNYILELSFEDEVYREKIVVY